MAGIVSQWMRPIFFYMLTSIWKRKPLLLAIIMVASFTVIALQYNSVSGQNKSNTNTDHHQNEIKFNGGNNKEKVDNLSPPRRNLSALGPIKSNSNNRNDVQKSGAAGDSVVGAAPPGLSGNNNKFGIFYGNEPVFGKKFNQIEDKLSDDRLRKVDNNNNNKMSKEKNEFYVPQYRLVHLDLKGAPPKISYLISLLPLIKTAGANGILIEYEDMFPYWDYLEGIAAKNAYSKDEIKLFLQSAEEHGMEVIPLVPTFGHMEFVLKLAKFRKLREYDPYPMALCPSRNESFILVQHMIDQIMMLHPSAKWLHIGCDEVFHMGYCDKCRNIDRDMLFLNYVTKVAKYVRDKHHVIPIVWDDMLRNIMPDRLRDSKIGQLVEPMIWTYVKDIYRFIPYPTFSYFSELFANVWAASAFKGAFGETLTAPNVKMHLENNQAWLEVMAEQHHNFKSFRGIAVTGWQRYDHLGTLCELLPSGLPSLIVDLITLKNGHYESTKVFKEFDKIMHCSSSSSGQYSLSSNEFDFESDPYLYSRASSCMFPGSSIFRMTQSVADAVKRVNDYIYDVTIHKAWLTEYNVRHNVSNPYRVDEGLEQHSNVHYILTSAFRSAASSLREAFDEYTVNEWIEQNIYPYLLKMEKLLKDGENLKKAKVWPRRPYDPLPDMKRFGL